MRSGPAARPFCIWRMAVQTSSGVAGLAALTGLIYLLSVCKYHFGPVHCDPPGKPMAIYFIKLGSIIAAGINLTVKKLKNSYMRKHFSRDRKKIDRPLIAAFFTRELSLVQGNNHTLYPIEKIDPTNKIDRPLIAAFFTRELSLVQGNNYTLFSTSAAFTQAVQAGLSGPGTPGQGVEGMWLELKTALCSAASSTIGMKRFVKQEWISSATLELIEERRAARLAQDRTRYRELNAKRRQALHHDHQVWADKLATEVESQLPTDQPRNAFKNIRRLRGQGLQVSAPIQAADGSVLSDNRVRLIRWNEYFNGLLNKPVLPVPEPLQEAASSETPDPSVRIDAPSLLEVFDAVGKLKAGKAAGCVLRASIPRCSIMEKRLCSGSLMISLRVFGTQRLFRPTDVRESFFHSTIERVVGRNAQLYE